MKGLHDNRFFMNCLRIDESKFKVKVVSFDGE